MKILYVGDGRGKLNWGANATSAALHELIEGSHTISGTVPNTAFYCPPFPFNLFIDGKGKKAPKGFMKKVIKKLDLKTDFIDVDIDASIKTFLKLKAYYPDLQDIYDKIMACDGLVVNGEGAFIFRKPPRRGTLFYIIILKLAQQLGKKTYCLNAMMSDCPITGRNEKTVADMVKVFSKCDGISLRDKLSYKILTEIGPELNFKFIPDALFTWVKYFKNRENLPVKGDGTELGENYDFSKPYICISGSSRARWTPEVAIPHYVSLVNKLKETNVKLYLIPTCSYDEFLNDVSKQTGVEILPIGIPVKNGAAIVANAAALVSGRFHPTILASLGGTPCVLMGSNSHKTLSLQEVLEYDKQVEYNAIPDEEDIKNMYADVQVILEQGDTLRDKILATVNRLSDQAKKVVDLLK
jgi:polysaccharide pyruvyl transferase WcaK-like protein